MILLFKTKILAVVSSALCLLLAIHSANAAVSMEKMDIKVLDDCVTVSRFTYIVDGKEHKCRGKKFRITPTKLKEMKMDIMLKPAGHRDNIWVFMPNKLPVRNIVKFELVDKTGKILKEDLDYRLDKKGAISQLKEEKGSARKKPIPTTAAFSYLPGRYDSVFLDPENGLLSLAQGPVRDVDAEEYVPATPSGKIRLCNIAVTGDRILVVRTYKETNTAETGDLGAF